jgi:Lipocalin-like domain
MPAVAESLIGPWKLVSFEFEFEDGQRQAAYDDAKGSLIITPDDRFVAILADDARREDDPPSVLLDRMMAYTGHISCRVRILSSLM